MASSLAPATSPATSFASFDDRSVDTIVPLADLFRLLGDPTRLRIVLACLDERRAVGAIAQALGLSPSLVSHHLRLLRAARIVRAERQGKQVFYLAADRHISAMLAGMLEHVAEPAGDDSLETHMKKNEHGHEGHGHVGHEHTDGHTHGHSHGHAGHHHAHAPVAGHGRAFALAVVLNIAIVIAQAVYGVLAHSTALLADAGHNLSDVLGLLLAWGASWLATRRPSARYTFGYGSSSILASLVNAGLLLFACGVIVAEAIGRLMNPAPVAGLAVFVVATVGVVVNGISAWLFMRGQKEDLNIRGAFLHMAADAGISAAVAVSGLVILYTNWTWLDPIMSLLVVAVVVVGTWGLLRDSVRLALDAVPPGVDLQGIRDYLAGQPGVVDVHDLHVWALSTTGNALSAHLVMPAGHPGDESLDGIVVMLRERFSMQHATLQVDLGTTQHRCAMDHAPHAH